MASPAKRPRARTIAPPAHLRAHGCDLALVQRGLAARRVPEDRQREVLDGLVGAPAR
jgi:hypothetical protein